MTTTMELKELVGAVADKQKKEGVTFKDVDVFHDDTTKQIILPDGMQASEAIKWLTRFEEQQEAEVSLAIEIEAFPLDGAVALARVLKDLFGWTNLVPTPGFFGPSPPVMLEIAIGPNETSQVHWGRMTIPGVDGFLETGFATRGKRCIFLLQGKVRRKHEKLMKGIAEQVRQRVKTDSIYRGKAVRINFRDEDGNVKQFNPVESPRFIDTSKVVEGELIFPAETQQLVDTTLFTPVEFSAQCRRMNVPLKRGVMLEGPYGVGKTLTANVLAKKCVDNGWTFLYVEDVRDLDSAIALAEMYSPAVVFGEDVDRAIGMDRDSEVDRILNTLDGVANKRTEIITVLTTNNVTEINQAMIRPGRIDTVVPVRPPDIDAAVRLVRLYGRNMVSGRDEDLKIALKSLLGSNAAVFRECVERAKLSAIRRLGDSDESLVIEPQDLGIAADTMRQHLQLLAPRTKPDERPMSMFGRAVGRELGTALLQDKSDKQLIESNGHAV